MLRCLICVLGWAIATTGLSQTLGLRSPSTKLRFIESDTVRVIYAPGQESEAARVADVIHVMARKFPIEGAKEPRKISIQLQNETDIPNGYVGLAPWRSEFYVSPPVDNFELGSLRWTDLLAVHEFRHVQQRSASNIGLSRAAYFLFGEAFFSAVVNMSWPDWYLEGDAVVAETVLTRQGRGRLPAFLNGYREKVIAGEEWDYHKARNGSFRDFVPSHYHLGFLLQNYGRARFGQSFWDDVALSSARYHTLFYPFSQAIEDVAEEPSPQFYASAMDYYRDLWTPDNNNNRPADRDVVAVRHDRYEDYNYPVATAGGDIYTWMESFDRVPGIYQVKDGQLDLVTYTGIAAGDIFSVAGGKVAWSEYRWHSRWERQDHASIIVYDIEKGKRRKLTHGKSYFSPVLSPDGKSVAALFDNDLQEYELHILQTENGYLTGKVKNPKNYYLSYLTWSADSNILYAAARDSAGMMAVARIDPAINDIRILNNWSYRVIGRVFEYRGKLYYTQSSGVVDVIHCLDISTGEVSKVSGVVHSQYNPVITAAGDVIYAEFSLDGHRLKSTALDSIEWETVQSPEPLNYLALEEGEGDILSEVPGREYESQGYGLFRQPIRLHSWRPLVDHPNYGFELQSLNVLQSLRWNTGFQWNFNEDDFGVYTDIALGMWYPEIIIGYDGWRRTFIRAGDGERFRWFEHTLNGGIRIPYRNLNNRFIANGFVQSDIQYITTTGDLDVSLAAMTHRVYYARRQRLMPKHPISRFAQAIDISYRHSVDADTASQFLLRSDFTFPSPVRNHVIWFQFDYMREPLSNNYVFTDNFTYSRGYDAFRSDWVYRIGVNYQLPLIYPDWGFGGIAYCNRIRANLFADISEASTGVAVQSFNSFGAELIFDVRLLNVQPVSFGVRYSYLQHDDPSNPGRRSRWALFIPFTRF